VFRFLFRPARVGFASWPPQVDTKPDKKPTGKKPLKKKKKKNVGKARASFGKRRRVLKKRAVKPKPAKLERSSSATSTGSEKSESPTFNGYSLSELPPEAHPQDRCNRGKHSYTIISPNHARVEILLRTKAYFAPCHILERGACLKFLACALSCFSFVLLDKVKACGEPLPNPAADEEDEAKVGQVSWKDDPYQAWELCKRRARWA
jgi:hypothetical protein